MKVKAINRVGNYYQRDSINELHRVHRNAAPELHPFEEAREYKRATNAAKLERLFAKPFLGSLDGHTDGIYCMAKNPRQLSSLASGACDGQIRIWNLIDRKCETVFDLAHKGFVRGLCFSPLGDMLISAGDDKVVKKWKIDEGTGKWPLHADDIIQGSAPYTAIDHHRSKEEFSTAGFGVQVWDHHRSDPIQTYDWGHDTVYSVRYNLVQTNILASTGGDRAIALYDTRVSSALQKVTLAMRPNAICWNPMEAFNFTAACEDHNLYTFDMRKLDMALNVHKDHVSSVLDVDYSPTGREFVSGSYDRTIRIFKVNEGHSREIYHTRRMQRLFSVKWSLDNKFILSGSEETNIRIWKANASEKLGTLRPREARALEYNNQLKERYKNHRQVKRVLKDRKVPKPIHKANKIKRVMTNAEQRKENNRRKHSKHDAPRIPERKKHVRSTAE
eukprot:Clim_evm6s152 gene=Clim_evmTU6s152